MGPQDLRPPLVAAVAMAARGPESCGQGPLMLLDSLGLWLSSSGIMGPASTVPPALAPLRVPVPPHLHLQMHAALWCPGALRRGTSVKLWLFHWSVSYHQGAHTGGFPRGSVVKNPLAVQETWV